MDDKPRIARATALMAANAYALIQAMAFIEARPELPPLALVAVALPAIGLSVAFGILEKPHDSPVRETLAAIPVLVLLLIWLAWQYNR